MGQSAQKIVSLDNGKLLEILNIAFAEEWLAYYQYWIGAKIFSVLWGPMYKKNFKNMLKKNLNMPKK